MATTAHISVEEYLAYTGKPNCEYIDGVLEPKAMGTYEHGRVQIRIGQLLQELGYKAAAEWTVRISPTKYLIPDIAADSNISGAYPDSPVLLCVEILSPDDRAAEMFNKCEIYHEWGVPYCWVVDPVEATAWDYHRHGAINQCSDALRAGDIRIELSAAFLPN